MWKTIRWPVAIIVGIVLIILVGPLMAAGVRFNLGGVLGWILGKRKDALPSVAVANSVPKGRVIAISQPDKNGWVQIPQAELKTSKNPFRDKSKISLPSGEKITLPEGVHDTDVAEVVVVKPEVGAVVRLKDGPTKIQTSSSVEDLLKQLEGLNK